MHAAKVEKSPRLQRILAFLRQRGERGATTLEIAIECTVVNTATYVSELRQNGFTIERTHERTTPGGAAVHRYRLVENIAPATLFPESA